MCLNRKASNCFVLHHKEGYFRLPGSYSEEKYCKQNIQYPVCLFFTCVCVLILANSLLWIHLPLQTMYTSQTSATQGIFRMYPEQIHYFFHSHLLQHRQMLVTHDHSFLTWQSSSCCSVYHSIHVHPLKHCLSGLNEHKKPSQLFGRNEVSCPVNFVRLSACVVFFLGFAFVVCT